VQSLEPSSTSKPCFTIKGLASAIPIFLPRKRSGRCFNRDHIRVPIWRTPRLFLCLLLSSILAIAQETTGGIQGTVKDPQGAVVTGATVEVAGPALIGKKVAKTDSGGFYHVEQLPPGIYDISISATGFSQQKKTGLKLEAGALPTVNVTLPVGTAAETVEVSGESELIDVTQSKVAVTVSDQILQNIPKGRSFQSVIQFAPGARQEPLSSRGRGNAAGMAGSGAGFQIDGASDSENTYLIEGMDTTNIQDGGVGKNVPMEFVQEVQVKSAGF
jgi:Carboxypeptidase regulatory-like domain